MTGHTVVVPLRNRWGVPLRNCLRSIVLQTRPPDELIIADYGSTPENHQKALKITAEFKPTVYRFQAAGGPWNRSTARNIGIRRSRGEYVTCLDADLIMAPRVLEKVALIHSSRPDVYLISRVRRLKNLAIDPDALELPRDYRRLREAPFYQLSEGWGGLMSASKQWFFKVRGFDERFRGWGWEDVDLWKRARRDQMHCLRLDDFGWDDCEVYHQYHPNEYLRVEREGGAELQQVLRNEEMTQRGRSIIRNDEDWGLGYEG